MKKQTISVTAADRAQLHKMLGAGQHNARVLTRARILLKADQDPLQAQAQPCSDGAIAQALNVGSATVGRVRRRYAVGGLAEALYDKPRPGGVKKLEPLAEALVIATACSKTPHGHGQWTLRMLAAKTVELGLVDNISYETIRQTLKKTNSNPGRRNSGVSRR